MHRNPSFKQKCMVEIAHAYDMFKLLLNNVCFLYHEFIDVFCKQLSILAISYITGLEIIIKLCI